MEVRVQGREVNQLDKDLRKAFDPRQVDKLTKAIDKLTAMLGKQAKQVRGLATAQKEAGRTGLSAWTGSERAARRYTKQLQEVGREAKKVESLAHRAARHGVNTFGGGLGMATGGTARMSMGTSGGVKGGLGGVPSLQGMGNAMTAIPVAGALMAGGLFAASQTYGSYLNYSKTRQSTTPFLTGGGGIGAMIGVEGRAGTARARAEALASAGANTPSEDAEIKRLRHRRDRVAGMREAAQRVMYDDDPRMQQYNAGLESDASISARARVGRIKSAGAAAYSRTYAAAGSAFASRAELAAIETAGAQFGVGPTAALGEASSISQAAKGSTGAGGYKLLKSMQALYGTSLQQGATVLGNFGRGYGGRADAGVADQQALAAVMARGGKGGLGLNASQMGDYLGIFQGLGARGTATGSTVNMMGLGRDMQRLGNTGFAPNQAARVGGEFYGGVMSMGQSGPQGAAGWAMMRAAGYTGGGGSGEYARAMGRMQNPDEGMLRKYVDQLIMPGMDADTQALVIQRGLGQVGTQVGFEQAKMLGRSGLGAQVGGTGVTAAMMSEAGVFAAGAAGAGPSRVEAGIEAKRIAAGGGIAGTVQAFSESMVNMAITFNKTLGPAITDFANGVEGATARLMKVVGSEDEEGTGF